MTGCQMPNKQCPNEGTVPVRIFPTTGDRRLCPDDLAVLDQMGVSYRRLEEPVRPVWAHGDLARDETARRIA